MGLGFRSQNTITEMNCVGSSRWTPSATSSAFIALYSHAACKAAACIVLTRKLAAMLSRGYSNVTAIDLDDKWVVAGGRTLEKLSASLPSPLTAAAIRGLNVCLWEAGSTLDFRQSSLLPKSAQGK